MFALAFSFSAILKFIWSVAGSAILGGVAALIAKGLQALHITVTATQQQQVIDAVTDAIHYAEELDANAKKSGGPGFSSKAKLQIATKFVVDRGIKSITPDQIGQLIQAILPQVGLGSAAKR